MVRAFRRGPVVICRQDDEPEWILWIGDRGCESDFRCLPLPEDLLESFEQSLAECSPPLALGLLDEFYHFPPRPYQVWSLEVRVEPEGEFDALKKLFDFSRLARRDRHVAGMSVYRGDAHPGVFMGFLGLTPGLTPTKLVPSGVAGFSVTEQREGSVVWRPLTVAYQVGRLGTGESVTGGSDEASSAPFWARSGVFPTRSWASAQSESAQREESAPKEGDRGLIGPRPLGGVPDEHHGVMPGSSVKGVPES
ncbi:MAG: hypothetical protein ACE5JD_07310 [Candidatus Methylomirabilia bacterium]